MKNILITLLLFSTSVNAQQGYLGFQSEGNLHDMLQPTVGVLILTYAAGTWESNQTVEASLFYDSSTSNVRLYYTGSSDSSAPSFNNRIGESTSSDMVTFTKSGFNPLIGQGHGGAPSGRRAHSSHVFKVGGTYYCLATNGYGYNYSGEDRNIYGYESSDGINWVDQGLKVNKSTAWSGGALSGFGNMCVVTDPHNNPQIINGKYVAIIEVADASAGWAMYKATADSLMGAWTLTNKLTSLQVVSGAMYGGPCAIYTKGVYHVFYHYGSISGNIPTWLAYAASTDGINWTIKEAPFMRIETSPFTNTDQIADPFITEIGGKTYMVAEYVQNQPTYYGELRLWSYAGTFDQMIKNESQ